MFSLRKKFLVIANYDWRTFKNLANQKHNYDIIYAGNSYEFLIASMPHCKVVSHVTDFINIIFI